MNITIGSNLKKIRRQIIFKKYKIFSIRLDKLEIIYLLYQKRNFKLLNK